MAEMLKMFRFPLLAVVIILSSGPIRGGLTQCPNQLPQKVRNIGYLGTSYNIFKGNPHSTHELDPGFMLQQVFALSYDQGQMTPDGCNTIPDYTNVKDASVCSFEYSSHSVRNIASYFLSLKEDVDASFGAYGASFSASADYNMVLKNTISEESRYVKSQAFCEAYLAVLQPGAKLSDGFKTAVEGLDNSDLDGYLAFIRLYGTHYLVSVTMGGRYGFQSEFETSEYMNLLSFGLDISLAAGYSGEIDIAASTSTGTQIKMAHDFNSHRKSKRIYQVGGKPPSDANGTAMAWAQTVKSDPLPIRYSLIEIAELFTSTNFGNDSNIETKQRNLKNATNYYCERDLSLTFCQSAGPSSEGSIRIVPKPSTNVKRIDLLNAPWFYQSVDSPTLAIMGMFITQVSSVPTMNQSYAVVDARNSAGNLITTASNWQVIDKYFLRPICRENFTRISDFAGQGNCDETAHCLRFLPKILPCVANQCLTQCSYEPAQSFPFVYNAYYITNGFKVFGNGNVKEDFLFFVIQDAKNVMCLTSQCVDDF